MKINNIDGEIVKDNETYLLKDNTSLKNLVVSSTTLHPGNPLEDILIQEKRKFI
jgi:hypothetical protein